MQREDRNPAAQQQPLTELPKRKPSELTDEEIDIISGGHGDEASATSTPVNCCLGRRGYHDME